MCVCVCVCVCVCDVFASLWCLDDCGLIEWTWESSFLYDFWKSFRRIGVNSWEFLYFLDTGPLSNMSFANILCVCVGVYSLSFHPILLKKSDLSIFPYAFGINSMNSLLNLNPKYFLLCFFTIVLTLSLIIHFGSIFV